MKIKNTLMVGVVALGLAACQSGPKAQLGGLLGAGGGALAGSQIGSGKGQLTAVAIGALGGMLLGNSIGNSLDELDQMKMSNTTQRTLEVVRDGQTSTWQNPNSGNSGSVVPLRTYQAAGSYCREFQQTVTVGGQQQSAYGTACRQPDGTWKIKG